MTKRLNPIVFALFLALAVQTASAEASAAPSVGASSPGAADELPSFHAGTAPAPPAPARPALSLPQAFILGAVEGITEFLPVSSTGHLLLVQRLLGLTRTQASRDAADAYAIIIQLGAILAVLFVSFGRIKAMARGIAGRDPQGLRLAGALAVAAVPAAAIWLVFENRIKQYLFDPWHIAIAWVVGGAFILLAMRRKGSEGGLPLEGLTWQKALVIGLAQCAALWPGVSRSLVTLAGGILLGLSVPAAVEFSFLLGMVSLGAATIFEAAVRGRQIVSILGWVGPLVGLAAAAITAFLAARWMVSYLNKNSPLAFGWYRIGLGVSVAALIFRGML